MDVSVIIVLHNSSADLADCLRSLPKDIELIIVDNDSADDGPALVQRLRPDACVDHVEKNLGFGGGCNRGARSATRDNLLFLNPDAVVTPEAVGLLLAAVEKHPKAIAGPAYRGEASRLQYTVRKRSSVVYDLFELLPSASRWVPQVLRRDVAKHHSVYLDGGWITYGQGACMMVSRRVFQAVGGFDEDFFLYGEEETLAERVARLGGGFRYVPDAVVVHRGAGSTGLVPDRSMRHLYRSKVILYRKRFGTAGGRFRGLVLLSGILAFGSRYFAMPGRSEDRKRVQAAIRGCIDGITVRLG